MNSVKLKLVRKIKGFTLIEVLVATVILISSLAAISMVYRGAFVSSEKADNHMIISGVIPSVLSSIQQEIRANDQSDLLQGEGRAWDTEYRWQANLVDFKSAPARFDVESRKLVTPAKRYKLWQVTLSLTYNNMSKDYQYNELSWINE